MDTLKRFGSICLFAILVAALPAVAADWAVKPGDDWCDDDNRGDSRCEVREATFAATGSPIVVDAGANGGISVEGTDGNELIVRAKVRTWNRGGRGYPKMDSIRVLAEGTEFRTDGPKGRSWSIGFQLLVPRNSDLTLESNNGGIRITDVDGRIRFKTSNGGVRLQGLAGDVQGRTTNGGLYVQLDGNRWFGEGLDVRTTNGGVNLQIPQGYSADLETGTTNGSIQVDFPIEVQGKIGKELRTQLGSGGSPVRVVTTNGGVRISEI